MRLPSEDARSKFDRRGNARPFPGSTIVCDVAPDSALGRCAERISAFLDRSAARDKWAILPPSSWHMTVIQLVTDQMRDPGAWSTQLPLDCPLEQADRHMATALAGLDPPSHLRMRCDRLRVGNGVNISLEPATPDVASALENYRDAVASATGVRRPDHDTYVFHMGLAYRLDALTAAEADNLEALTATAANILATSQLTTLGTPYLAFFDDMLAFPHRRPS